MLFTIFGCNRLSSALEEVARKPIDVGQTDAVGQRGTYLKYLLILWLSFTPTIDVGQTDVVFDLRPEGNALEILKYLLTLWLSFTSTFSDVHIYTFCC